MATATAQQLRIEETSQEPDAFTEMFRKVADDLNRRYIRGTDDYVREHHLGLQRDLRQAEDELNRVWSLGREGRANAAMFREALSRWQRLHVRAREVFKAARE